MRKSTTKYDRLLPFSVIQAAVSGDPDSVAMVLCHFSGYIAALSKRHFYDRNGNYVTYIDNDIQSRLETKLIFAILRFDLS